MNGVETLTIPLEEAMRTQRAIRRLKPDPVDDGLVLHLIELALTQLPQLEGSDLGKSGTFSRKSPLHF